jgi:hypothetical protein
MEKYNYDTEVNEKLTEVRVNKVWLKEHLMLDYSKFQNLFPDCWILKEDDTDLEFDEFFSELRNLHQMITTNSELFILYIITESYPSSGENKLEQRAYLTDKDDFRDITWIIDHTSLLGFRFEVIHPTYEDFVNEFIGEIYF